MVNMNNNEQDVELEPTNEEGHETEETELIDEEEKSSDTIKKLKKKIARLEDEKKQILDDSQRAKADFLNARKRLDEERARDKVRHKKLHVEELLPLCDSFQMAMQNKEAWEKADKAWRTGIEGIHSQLMQLLTAYDVTVVDPKGEKFDPYKHEAIGTEAVEDESTQDTVVSVVQMGYEMKVNGNTELIRPARVTTGILKD